MAMQDIGVSIVGKIAEKFIDPIMRQFQYLFCYRSNIETLRNGIKKLELTKTEVQRSVDEARNNGEEIKPIVTDWLRQANGLEKEADTIFEGMENVKVNCFKIVRLPNLKSRYLIGRHAAKRGNDAEKHLRERWFDEVGYLPPLGKMPFSESTPSFEESLITRMSMKREVIEALKQDKRSLLAICGMAGVGKTFLLEQIADQVKSEKLFDGVAFATVSQNPDIRNVQNQLAEQLRMTLISEHSGRARAEQIYTRLTNSDERNLVMLDDIWEEVDLRSLGIPIRLGECKGLKVVLTSRFSHVCRNMEAEIFEVNALPKEEAWHLFKKVVGISDDSALSDVVKQVAEECKGLPLAIVVVARAFRTNYTTPESWKLALGQLKKYTMRDLERVQDFVFSRIEWSYDRLKSVEAKLLLLFCSLFPEDYSIPVECLVRYGKGLEIQLQEMKLQRINFIEYLWKGPIEPPSLCNLRVIEVSNCQRITTLFSQSVLKCLVNLQKIVVHSCKNLESIVMREENMKDQVLELLQLKVVTLQYTGLEGFGCEGDTYSKAFLNQVSLSLCISI
ncbi:unnamed protein product [Coffea canephora]|uniref:DH200=94 genomic scaffold, scaffold_535 n=1 Tax=Coffea canephora TaxID=49390 RepID=A0A068VFM4_COFCA|nr:unnamed protein product [Coffea canephora]